MPIAQEQRDAVQWREGWLGPSRTLRLLSGLLLVVLIGLNAMLASVVLWKVLSAAPEIFRHEHLRLFSITVTGTLICTGMLAQIIHRRARMSPVMSHCLLSLFRDLQKVHPCCIRFLLNCRCGHSGRRLRSRNTTY
jgi:hypothetical protein